MRFIDSDAIRAPRAQLDRVARTQHVVDEMTTIALLDPLAQQDRLAVAGRAGHHNDAVRFADFVQLFQYARPRDVRDFTEVTLHSGGFTRRGEAGDMHELDSGATTDM